MHFSKNKKGKPLQFLACLFIACPEQESQLIDNVDKKSSVRRLFANP